MTLTQQLEANLHRAFAPVHMTLENESHQHKGPGQETHFNLIIVSRAFEGQSLLQRQRGVYAAVGDQIRQGLHALTMKTLTPDEWEQAEGDVSNRAPPCRGSGTDR